MLATLNKLSTNDVPESTELQSDLYKPQLIKDPERKINFCPNCGTKLSELRNFCALCGSAIN